MKNRTRDRNKFLLPIIVVFSLQLCVAQTYLGNYSGMSTTQTTSRLFAGSASIQFTFYAEDVVRVDFLPTGSTVSDSSFVVVQTSTNALTPIITETSTSVILQSSKLKIVCTKNPLRISYNTAGNIELVTEPPGGGFATNGKERISNFVLPSDEHFYGTGERGTSLDKRGLAFDSYNIAIGGYVTPLPNMAANIPFLASSKGYGIYFDNTYKGRFDLGKTTASRYSYTAFGGELTYYFILGETVPKQIERYTWLSGRQPMPPKWALGFIQSKYGYRNETEARTLVQTIRNKKIPCDAIIIDLYWFNYMGDISWKLADWPQPHQMMSDFLTQGIKTIVITEPYITQPSLNYNEAAGLGYLGKNSNNQPYTLTNWWSCGCNAYLLDITHPQAAQWWWSKHPPFFGNEMAGIWTDLGEPERHPDSMHHSLGTTPKIHNVYNLLWAKTVYEGFHSMRPNERFFNLTRSGFAGIQRYATSIWSGDVGRNFGGLAVQMPMLLNMGISGIGYHNSDIGGFCCGTTTPELYTRWMQYGTFCPITRAHGVDQPTEPWGFDSTTEAISKAYIELRYQFMPYIYTMAYENHQSGMPLARPLFFLDPDDGNLTNESSSYLWGSSILVSPVVQEGQTSKSLYLPAGKWIDFWTDREATGGQTITASAPLEKMPIFIKAGSILPMQFVMNYTDERTLDTLRLAVYPSVSDTGSFTMYEDDGKTLHYTTGAFATTTFSQRINTTVSDTAITISIGNTKGDYSGKPEHRTYLSEIHSLINKPSSVRINSTEISEASSYASLREQAAGYYHDTLHHILYIQLQTVPDSTYEIVAEKIRLLGLLERYEFYPSKTFRLEQNYPNPFNPNTVIRYQVSASDFISMKVYNILGEEVSTLINEKKQPGNYEVTWNAETMPSGMYLYRLQSGGYVDTKKSILLK